MFGRAMMAALVFVAGCEGLRGGGDTSCEGATCSGQDGTDGEGGNDGADGADGLDGADGGAECGDGTCDPGELCPSDCASSGSDVCPDRGAATWNGSLMCNPLSELAQLVLNELQTLWGAGPALVCSYDPTTLGSTGCGQLFPENAFYCGADDSISYDVVFFDRLVATLGDFAAVAVLAHEWGHLNQQRLNLFSLGLPTIFTELHADCQAGIFAALEERAGHLDEGDMCEAFLGFCQFGDPEGTPWFAEGAHGTCTQREEAFRTGYEGAKLDPDALCTAQPFDAMMALCQRYIDGGASAATCGNGVCEAGEAGICADCASGSSCTDPSFPVDCGDGTGCWTPNTICSNPAFACGSGSSRCGPDQGSASCCAGSFITCRPETPYLCPATATCHAEPPGCDTSVCTFVDAACGG